MKKSYFKIIFIIVFFQLFRFNVKAQNSNQEYVDNNILNYKIETLNKINDKTLNSIYRTLGIFTTLFIGIIALNFYQNFTINKRKIDDIEENISKKFALKIGELGGRNEEIIQKKINSQYNTYKNKFDSLEKNYNDLKRDLLITQSEYYKNKNQIGEIMCIIEVLELDIKGGQSWRIHNSLDLVKNYLSENTETESYIKGDIQDLLSKLDGEEYKIQKEEIDAAMRK